MRKVLVPGAAIALLGALTTLCSTGVAAPAPYRARTCWSQPQPTWTSVPTPTPTFTGVPTTTQPGTGTPGSPSQRGTPGTPAPGTGPSGPTRPTRRPGRAAGTDWHGWWGGERIRWWPQRNREAEVTGGIGTGGLAAGPWVMQLQQLADAGSWNERAAMGEGIAYLRSPLLIGVSLRLMNDPNDQVARQGVFATAASMPTAAAGMISLRRLLANPRANSHRRAAAAMALGALGDPAGRDTLLRWAQQQREVPERIGALIGLGLLPDVSVIPMLQRILQDKRARTVVQGGAAIALGLLARTKAGAKAATDAMLAAARNADKLNTEARQTLALNLGHAEPTALAVRRLAQFVENDGDMRTRALAAVALGRMARRHRDVVNRARGALVTRWGREPPSVKAFLALAMGIGRMTAERSRLEHWLHGRGDPRHRGAAAVALGLMGERDAHRALAKATREGPPQFRGDACEGLGLLGGNDAARTLRALTADKNASPPVTAGAAYGLGLIGLDADRKVLEKLLAQRNADARVGAVLGLGAFAGNRVRNALLARAKTESIPSLRGLTVYAALLAVAERPLGGPAKAIDRSPWAREH